METAEGCPARSSIEKGGPVQSRKRPRELSASDTRYTMTALASCFSNTYSKNRYGRLQPTHSSCPERISSKYGGQSTSLPLALLANDYRETIYTHTPTSFRALALNIISEGNSRKHQNQLHGWLDTRPKSHRRPPEIIPIMLKTTGLVS